MARDFYTPSEVAKILGVPNRRIFEWLTAGEIEAERDLLTGRWRIPKASLNASETERLTQLLTEEEAELRARLQFTERALSTLEARAQALRKERDRSEEERARLRAELEAERSKGVWRRLFGG
jgi:excisionase family DNA binding protein